MKNTNIDIPIDCDPNYRKNAMSSKMRQKKCRERFLQEGGRMLELSLTPACNAYLDVLTTAQKTSRSKYLSSIINDAASKIRYPLDVWLKRICLPNHLNEADILSMCANTPLSRPLCFCSYRLLADGKESHELENNGHQFDIYLYKKEFNWQIHVYWLHEAGMIPDRFPKQIGLQSIFCDFTIEDGFVIFAEDKREIEHKLTVFCRYAEQVRKQITRSFLYKGYQWSIPIPSQIPYFVWPPNDQN